MGQSGLRRYGLSKPTFVRSNRVLTLPVLGRSSLMSYRVGIIGTGDPTASSGYAMAYRHGEAYERLAPCELAACADIVEEHARTFADSFEIDPDRVYTDYDRMLEEVEPTLVSVCTPTPTHAEIVINCCRSPSVRAIHCEKPMGATWKECREMVEIAADHDVQLTFNHQRRFAAPIRNAKTLLEEGRIGDIRRVEVGGPDLYDYGTHVFDFCGKLTDQEPISWVIGQIDRADPRELYGLPQERRAVAEWHYESGITGIATTGDPRHIKPQLRLIGSEGRLEIGHPDYPPLRIQATTGVWETIDTGRDGIWRPSSHPADRVVSKLPYGPDNVFSEPTYVDRAIADVIRALDTDYTSELDAANALQATELIFGIWESARRRDRVDLPLEIDDNPLVDLVEDSHGTASPTSHGSSAAVNQ